MDSTIALTTMTSPTSFATTTTTAPSNDTIVPRQLLWNPSICKSKIDKKAVYLVRFEDFELNLSPYTQFEQNGLLVRVYGTQLYHLLDNKTNNATTVYDRKQAIAKNGMHKSLRNVCFVNTQYKRQHIINTLRKALKLPACIELILKDILVRPRNGRFRKRFVFNCYISNLLTCTKCNKQCIERAMIALYQNDEKCVREFQSIFNIKTYKPPNCDKMAQKDKLCHRSLSCKGSNPICNF
uniref:Late expression factor 2 n=1 Tax=Helicoverpa armigera nucleopolyhedrovirus TaxID=51313 RepID=A0A0E3GI74_9ABAC|nr:late expression factor 2 [Helicoverpa armigera nucleopolyhedrovirus]